MGKKLVLAVLFALTLCPVASLAQVVIRIGPPPPVVEVRGEPPQQGYVWIGGYHRYEGDHYVWTAGRWDRPPHAGQHWVSAHWVNHHGQWVMVQGYWR